MKHLVSFRAVRALTLSASIFLPPYLYSQTTVVPLAEPAPPLDDKSFYLGQSVLHPEEISGVWEAPDGHGGAIGINLKLSTTIPGDATLSGVSQSWRSLELGLYQRTGAALVFGDENFFGDSPRGGGVRYKDGRLTLADSQFDLNLIRTNADTWSGRFHRYGFDSTVTLTRLTVAHSNARPSFIGTWKAGGTTLGSCIHIAEQASGALIGWEDSLTTHEVDRCPNPLPQPAYLGEYYGEMLQLSTTTEGTLSIESNAIGGVCCPHLFYATLSDDGTTMKADWPAGLNQTPHKDEWKKMSGNTCITKRPSRLQSPRSVANHD